MQTFNLRFFLDNEAFDEAPASEIARILREVASEVEDGTIPPVGGLAVRDSNGNTVGHWEVY